MSINTKAYIEEYIKIRDKSGRIIDLKLNQGQLKLYEAIKKQRKEGKPVRIIILKARQIGFSTLTEAIIFKETATKFNINSGIITHKEEATTNLFNMSKRMYDNLPTVMQPDLKASNAKELVFDNKEGTGLKSKIKCMTAGSSGVGRSDTFNNLHISELAFWGDRAKETALGLFQAVPNLPNTMIVIESTANGYEYFKTLWDLAVRGKSDFIPIFVGWHEMEEYKMPYTGFKLTEKEKELQQIYGVTLEQLTWRRWCIQNNCAGDESQFIQEYPINPHEAFLSTGTCPFDKGAIINRLETIPKPLKVGYFKYNYDGMKITNIQWINDPNGSVKIYKIPNVPKQTKYCIGGDTAGDGSDYYTGHVLDAKTGDQVAVLKQQFDPDEYVKQMYCLGYYYLAQVVVDNEIIKEPALMAIEANFDSFPIKELTRLGYTNQYVREKVDTYTGQKEKRFGFKTTVLTRPTIISNLIEIVREHTDTINDEDTLQELLTIIRNEKGRIEAPEGGHDDQMMGLAIAHEARTQVTFNVVPIPKEMRFNFNIEKPVTADYGEEIQVI